MNSAGSRQQASGRPRTRQETGRLPVAVCLLVVAVCAAACGKKGAPLAPFSNLPAAVTSVTVKRIGSQLAFRFTVPTTNVDGRQPADLDRVELYVHTVRLLQPGDYLELGALVGSITVRRPAPPVEDGQPTPVGGQSPVGEPTPSPGVDQGAVTTIVERSAQSPPASVPVTRRDRRESEVPESLFADGGGPLLSPRRAARATRYYVLVGVNREGRPGALSPVVEVAPIGPPSPPTDVRVTNTESELTVAWTPPSTPLRHPIQDPVQVTGALSSRPVVAFTSVGGYNVYDVPPDRTAADADWTEAMLTPLNSAPVTETSFQVAGVEFGTPRCFMIRTQETVGGIVVESPASRPVCSTPVDTFPPAATRSVAAVASEGTISLIWEANTEPDLKGYLVLRGEAPGEKLQALMTAPITETTYRDATARGGVEYVYAVVAVDKADNISAESNRVVERGR